MTRAPEVGKSDSLSVAARAPPMPMWTRVCVALLDLSRPKLWGHYIGHALEEKILLLG